MIGIQNLRRCLTSRLTHRLHPRSRRNQLCPKESGLRMLPSIMPGKGLGGRASNDGYTLIETLVAVMLLAISLVTIMQLFSGGLRAIRLSNDFERAVFHAQERMEAIRLSPYLVENKLQGQLEDGYRWEAVIRDLDAAPTADPRKAGILTRFSVTVSVHWPSGEKDKTFSLDALRTVPLGTSIDE